jgi:hypothetical protein
MFQRCSKQGDEELVKLQIFFKKGKGEDKWGFLNVIFFQKVYISPHVFNRLISMPENSGTASAITAPC